MIRMGSWRRKCPSDSGFSRKIESRLLHPPCVAERATKPRRSHTTTKHAKNSNPLPAVDLPKTEGAIPVGTNARWQSQGMQVLNTRSG